jgi:MOSC domain-containing protein
VVAARRACRRANLGRDVPARYIGPVPPVLTSIRRYPVKAMGGESLHTARLDARGIVGDRWFAVRDAQGHFACGKNSKRFRRHDEVFAFTAASVEDQVTVHRDGRSWTVGDPALDDELSAAFAAPVRVVEEDAVPHFDDAAISIVGSATLAWCAQRWGIDADSRRLRVNLVVATDEPFVEESWLDHDVEIGTTTLRVVRQVERCRTVDVAQDGASARGRWLTPLTAERDMCVAVYADVLTPGQFSVGDAVTTV